MDDLIKEFLVESNENLDRLDSELVKLESDPSSQGLLSSIFRTIHTIKGSCGFLEFSKLEKVAHAGESVLSRLRDGKISLVPELTSGLLAMVDAIRTMLDAIQATEQDGKESYPDLIETLVQLQLIGQEKGAKPAPPAPPSELSKNAGPGIEQAGNTNTKERQEETAENVPSWQPDSRVPVMPVPPQDARPRRADIAVSSGLPPAEHNSSPPSGPEEVHTASAPGESIRVDVHLLDRLMNLVGELVLTGNQITQFSARQEDPNLTIPTQKLNLLTSELQEEVMKTRMQPISNIFDKFPRVVRDIAMSLGKQVQIEMEGKETELDKSLLEAIKDPLTHIVRNSLDHGIEMPEQRVARGKRPEGRIKLRACHEGGQVLVEISDDGAGIDSALVKSKALERGLITGQQAAHMNEREVLSMIFLPGFSTAEKVTNFSGRGVGMDVVKTNIDRVNGSVDLQSTPGKGSTVKIKIPLTLAIVRAVIIQSNGKRFAIPQASIQELVCLDGDSDNTGIEQVHGVPVYRIRGRLLPLVYLNEELKLKKNLVEGKVQNAAANIVVLQADDHLFGLVVDEIIDSEEIVVKALGKQLKATMVFAGATIMGDGKVALILDVVGLAQSAGILTGARDSAFSEKSDESLDTQAQDQDKKETFLLFTGPDEGRMALPLSLVARLEEFPASIVEKSGNEWVVQYRGKILPLIRLDVVLEERRTRRRHTAKTIEPDRLQVLVCNDAGRTLGIVVDRILDIVEDTALIKSSATREGVQHAVVINERVTELLDIPAIQRIAEENRSISIEHVGVSD
jgi:two-component system, chemotaxis family, sensor kinase CheA